MTAASDTGKPFGADLVAALRRRVADDFGADLVAHDLSHLDRVARLAEQIATAERHDPLVVQLIAYVHDYHRVAEARWGRHVDSAEVLPRIREILDDLAIPADVVAEIERAVLFNDKYTIKGDHLDGGTVAARIARDADKLDASGAIGVARAFMYGGASHAEMWDPTAPLQATYRSGHTSSVVAHFYEKLVHLPGEMLTATGKRLAEDRTAFLIAFLDRFHREWGDRPPELPNRSGPNRP